jgi:hypothetical protein
MIVEVGDEGLRPGKPGHLSTLHIETGIERFRGYPSDRIQPENKNT